MICRFIWVLFFLTIFILNAQDSSIQISQKYHIGRGMIYDCVDRHFVCAAIEEFDECKLKREKEVNKYLKEFSCAPIKLFKNNKECVIKMRKYLERSIDKSFCYEK